MTRRNDMKSIIIEMATSCIEKILAEKSSRAKKRTKNNCSYGDT